VPSLIWNLKTHACPQKIAFILFLLFTISTFIQLGIWNFPIRSFWSLTQENSRDTRSPLTWHQFQLGSFLRWGNDNFLAFSDEKTRLHTVTLDCISGIGHSWRVTWDAFELFLEKIYGIGDFRRTNRRKRLMVCLDLFYPTWIWLLDGKRVGGEKKKKGGAKKSNWNRTQYERFILPLVVS